MKLMPLKHRVASCISIRVAVTSTMQQSPAVQRFKAHAFQLVKHCHAQQVSLVLVPPCHAQQTTSCNNVQGKLANCHLTSRILL